MGSRIKLLTLSILMSLLTACQPDTTEATVTDTSTNPSSIPVVETDEQTAARLLATFPAQQRAPGDQELIAQGELIFGISCRACHGVDLRGGDLGGPNLLRSPLVLNDQAGELISPVIKEGRNNPGMTVMPPQGLSDADIDAVSAYIHSVVATSERQGAPPRGEEIVLNILVGDPEAGQQYFEAECTGCHSITGDLQGYASKVTEPMSLQNSWVAGRRRGPPDPNADPSRRQVSVVVSMASGEQINGELKRIDDFLISLTTTDGRYRSFTRSSNDEIESIVITDPMTRHIELLSEYTDDIMHNVTAYLVTLK